ncbi:hypothetical protein SAMN05216333_10882 [Nitrosomonas oligotropha]|uniref:Uncharacterized protein n=1 Tax=Nitrosomonas oligotropha TaxID=42354 RepID=A0A1H8NYI3_9PROT|nr:hypothetical protein SAMN05216300_10750 [Nitrosomonas oligotropha]SEO34433.1 hypothetical protein SAMN05216333_10882 [Nitrosomonas oligotropha]
MTDERKLNVAQPVPGVISAAYPDSSATFVIECILPFILDSRNTLNTRLPFQPVAAYGRMCATWVERNRISNKSILYKFISLCV